MWYYSSDGQQQGPFDDAVLDQLISTGTVTPDTYLWKEGLTEWTPLKQLRPPQTKLAVADPTGLSTCTMCGKSVGTDNLVELANMRVCAACKPMAVQSLREGVSPATVNGSAWSDGKNVVTHNNSSLPPRCYKCNHAAQGPPLKRQLSWHPLFYYLLIAAGLLIYVIVAIIVRKRATVDIYLCNAHAQRRKYFIYGGVGGIVLSFMLIVIGIGANIPVLTVLSIPLFLASIIVSIAGSSLGSAARIKGDTVWLKGAGKDFLASLPEWNR